MAGIFNGGECGPNSENVLDEHGESTGELREPGAFKPVSDMVPKPDEARKRALLQKALAPNCLAWRDQCPQYGWQC